MNRPDYSISTPENVDLHLELAGLGSRVWAAFVDMALIYLMLIVIIVIALLAALVIGQLEMMPSETKSAIYFYIVGVALLAVFALQFGYFILFEKLWQGQTPGKRIAQIRVIEANGQPVGWSSVIIRNLIRIVDNLLMVGIVFIIFDKTERRLGDLLGGTLVIRERQPELSARTLRLNTEVPDSSFVDAGQVSPDEYHLLVSFLRRRHQMNTSSRSGLARQLSDYFREKLSPADKGESPELLLEKVYLAYSQKAQQERA